MVVVARGDREGVRASEERLAVGSLPQLREGWCALGARNGASVLSSDSATHAWMISSHAMRGRGSEHEVWRRSETFKQVAGIVAAAGGLSLAGTQASEAMKSCAKAPQPLGATIGFSCGRRSRRLGDRARSHLYGSHLNCFEKLAGVYTVWWAASERLPEHSPSLTQIRRCIAAVSAAARSEPLRRVTGHEIHLPSATGWPIAVAQPW